MEKSKSSVAVVFFLPGRAYQHPCTVDIFAHKCDTNNICKVICCFREHSLSITNINRVGFQATAAL